MYHTSFILGMISSIQEIKFDLVPVTVRTLNKKITFKILVCAQTCTTIEMPHTTYPDNFNSNLSLKVLTCQHNSTN